MIVLEKLQSETNTGLLGYPEKTVELVDCLD